MISLFRKEHRGGTEKKGMFEMADDLMADLASIVSSSYTCTSSSGLLHTSTRSESAVSTCSHSIDCCPLLIIRTHSLQTDRDIKPQNLLIHPTTGVLKLIDFGSAKILVAGEPNVSYICSRYYRAPELIFGATNYSTNIGKS